ncbi:MAG: phosphoribosylglycinamide formyltransferase [Gammaproteobacteria bacterium]
MAFRLVVLISGRGSNLDALIAAQAAGLLQAEIVAVISNRPSAKGLMTAQSAGIKTAVIDHTQFEKRAEFDRELAASIDAQAPDLVVLAGFMRVLTAEFVEHYLGRMINIHPSLLPDFPGLHTHRRALEAGREVHGASVHFVSVDVDGGPVVLQTQVPVLPDDDEDSLAARVLKQEHRILPLATHWVATGRLKYAGGKPTLDQAPITQAPIITAEDETLPWNAPKC